MRDFTLHTYSHLLSSFLQASYRIMAFEDYLVEQPQGRVLILRHDVDKRADNSLQTALIEHDLGVRASYYFRVIKQSNRPDIIRRIASLGHEIGYHYEDMALCGGNKQQALQHFIAATDYFRTFYPVRTCCMHGAPANRYDGRDLWRDDNGSRHNGGDYDYRSYGYIGEPYFDVDFGKVFYLTDTGGMWDGWRVSVRDKVKMQAQWNSRGWHYHTSEEIVNAVTSGSGPFDSEAVMMTTHPQRWDNRLIPWLKERTTQHIKNIVKRAIVWAGE